MAAEKAPTLGATLRRIGRIACPACGKGPLFRSFFIRTEACSHCRRPFERGAGYWVGGSEVHMFVSYGISVVLCVPMLVLLGPTPAVMAGVIAAHVVISLAFFRYSRAIFLGIDYYLDPGPPAPDDDGDGDGEAAAPVRPRTPPTRARRRASPLPHATRRRQDPAKTP